MINCNLDYIGFIIFSCKINTFYKLQDSNAKWKNVVVSLTFSFTVNVIGISFHMKTFQIRSKEFYCIYAIYEVIVVEDGI